MLTLLISIIEIGVLVESLELIESLGLLGVIVVLGKRGSSLSGCSSLVQAPPIQAKQNKIIQAHCNLLNINSKIIEVQTRFALFRCSGVTPKLLNS